LIGAGLGAGIQRAIPVVFKNFIPLDIPFAISWPAIYQGLALGAIVSVLFTILPLVAVRFVPPLAVLRSESLPTRRFSRMRFTAIVLIVLFPIAAATAQAGSWKVGFGFAAGMAVALAALAGVAWALLRMVRRFFPKSGSFAFRHALSNLFRPNNQTQVLMVTIGLGGFIIATLNIIQHSLLGQIEFTGSQNESNTILFDIQPSQRDQVVDLIKEHKLPVNQVVPIITCRLRELRGRPVEALQQDTSVHIPDWALMREYRVTYRDSLHRSEELIKGDLHRYEPGQKDSVFVTISEGMQETLKLELGDSLLFDIQGVPVKVKLSGIRKVDWPKDPPNFIFVFPNGVLNQAPQIWVAATRVDSIAVANRFQQRLVMGFPNVSLLDLRLILSTVEELFDKVGLVVRFLAMFSIITGLIVLAGAVVNSKFVRIRENVLLRTIGARTRQITQITLIEYAYLGLFSAITGMILSLAGGWALCTWFFEVQMGVSWTGLAAVGLGVTLLTIFIGWYNSREVIGTPPLQVLRRE
jgi:putative ABC transport system permease protein